SGNSKKGSSSLQIKPRQHAERSGTAACTCSSRKPPPGYTCHIPKQVSACCGSPRRTYCGKHRSGHTALPVWSCACCASCRGAVSQGGALLQLSCHRDTSSPVSIPFQGDSSSLKAGQSFTAGSFLVSYLPNTRAHMRADATAPATSAISAAASVYLIFLMPTEP